MNTETEELTVEAPGSNGRALDGEEVAERVTERLKLLSADDILRIDDLPTQQVEIPEWNGYVVIRAFTQAEADEINKLSEVSHRDPEKAAQGAMEMDRTLLRKLMWQRGVVQPRFTMEQIEGLWNKSVKAVGRVVQAMNEINGNTPTSKEKADESFRKRS